MIQMFDMFLVHCVHGCHRGEWIRLAEKKPDEVVCKHCGSDRIAIWKERRCVFSYSGKVDYPMGRESYGDIVRGGM